LTQKLAALEKRMLRLENAVQTLENDGGIVFAPAGSEFPPVRPGPKARWNRAKLLHERDKLYEWCSYHWPELSLIIRKARSQKQLQRDLETYNKSLWKSEHAEHLIANSDSLWEFTQTERFTGNPQQVANALAGVPQNAWRTSLNVCSDSPSRMGLNRRAYRDHLRRKFPERLRELLKAKSVEQIAASLDRARTKDAVIEMLRRMPEQVPEILHKGEPRLLNTKPADQSRSAGYCSTCA
jgi:hypothetical protein